MGRCIKRCEECYIPVGFCFQHDIGAATHSSRRESIQHQIGNPIQPSPVSEYASQTNGLILIESLPASKGPAVSPNKAKLESRQIRSLQSRYRRARGWSASWIVRSKTNSSSEKQIPVVADSRSTRTQAGDSDRCVRHVPPPAYRRKLLCDQG